MDGLSQMLKSFAKTLVIVYSAIDEHFLVIWLWGFYRVVFTTEWFLYPAFGSKLLCIWGGRGLRLRSQNACCVCSGECGHNPCGWSSGVWLLPSPRSTWGVFFKHLGPKILKAGSNRIMYPYIQGLANISLNLFLPLPFSDGCVQCELRLYFISSPQVCLPQHFDKHDRSLY